MYTVIASFAQDLAPVPFQVPKEIAPFHAVTSIGTFEPGVGRPIHLAHVPLEMLACRAKHRRRTLHQGQRLGGRPAIALRLER